MWTRSDGNAGFRDWLEPILRAHAQVVRSRYVGAWNHGTMQSLALLAAGCVLDEVTWRDIAAARLQTELVAGIDTQGAILEQAPGYASFIQGLHRNAAAHLVACGMPVAAGRYDRVELVDTYAAQATRPGGTFVEIGDTFSERPNPAMGPNSAWVATGERRARNRRTWSRSTTPVTFSPATPGPARPSSTRCASAQARTPTATTTTWR